MCTEPPTAVADPYIFGILAVQTTKSGQIGVDELKTKLYIHVSELKVPAFWCHVDDLIVNIRSYQERERERFYSQEAGIQKGHAHQTWCLLSFQ